MSNTLDMIHQLCSAGGISGYEKNIARAAADLLTGLVDEVTVDRLNNVIGVRRCGKPNAKKLVLDAHLDEIGLVVNGIENGFLRFCAVGGVDPRILPGLELTILADQPLTGVVVCIPPHISKENEREKTIPISGLLIDVGLSQQQAEELIPLGTPIVYRESCFQLGTDKLCGKSMDDRACFVSLLRTLELLQDKELDIDLYVVGSTFEEVGGNGAKTAVFSIAPNWCVAVDVTHGRTPDAPTDQTFPLGSGPVIGLGPNVNRWMSQRLKEKAKANDIAVQLEVMAGHSGTNAWPIQISREGIATAVLSLPLRYMHTPVEVMEQTDLENLAQLLASFVLDIGREAPTC